MKLGSGPLSFWLLLLFAACIFLKMSTNVAFMLNFGKCTGQGSVGIRCDLPKMTQTNAVQTAGESRELWRNTVKQTALEALDPSSLSPLALTSSPQANSHHCEMVVILFVTTRWSHSVLLLPDHTSIEGWRNFERGKSTGRAGPCASTKAQWTCTCQKLSAVLSDTNVSDGCQSGRTFKKLTTELSSILQIIWGNEDHWL